MLSGLLAHWKMNEESGSRADSSGHGHTLTDNNSVGYAVGKLGNAAEFVFSSSQTLVNAGLPMTGLPAASFSGWFKSTGSRDLSCALTLGAASDDFCGIQIYPKANGGHLYMTVATIGANYDYTVGEWLHIAVSMGGGLYKVFLNGELAASGEGIPNFNTDGVIFGNDNENRYNEGLVDSVSVWNRALSDEDVAALYNSGDGLDYESFTL